MTKKTLMELATNDMSRSGLTLEDISGGEVVAEPVLRQRLGFEKSLPAKGGYAIPYFGLDGNPIMDCGVPYERFRLLGIESDSDIGKYLSPLSTSAHLYIPRQLNDALNRSVLSSKALIITEGEKKAIAACKASIPCVALPGITMYRSADDKDRLHEEIRDLLVNLFESNRIFTVITMFDSDGYPLKATQLPTDKEEAGKYMEIKSGMQVRNRDVFNHAFRLSGLIRQTIAGLMVGYTWCQPAYTASTGPKGGKVLVVEKVGIDDALVAGRAKEVVEWIENAVGRAREGDGEGGYIPLGMLSEGLTAVLWSIPQNRLMKVGVASLNNSGVLAAICGKSWLEQKFTKFTRDGAEMDVKAASADIASRCAGKGDFREGDRVFGTGVWSPDKRAIVVNTHHAVYAANGETLERIDENRKEIYLGGGSMTPPAFAPVSDAEYQRVCDRISDDLDTWTWENNLINPVLIMGWMTMVVYLGLMERRPHVWLVGPRGSGKSRLLAYLKHMLIGYLKHTDMGSVMTEAGLRQILQNSCFAFLIDELEKENTDNGLKLSTAIDQVLKFMRAAYSASSTVFKGTADQRGIEFRIQTSVMAASIAEPALEPADRSRIVMVKMQPRQGISGQPPKNLSPEESAIFFWGTIQRWGRFQHIYEVVQRHWTEEAGAGGDGREMETFGTLLAAGMVTIPEIQTDDHIRLALHRMVYHIQPQLDDVRQGSAEHEIILQTLLTQNIPVEYHETDDRGNTRINRETRSVGGLVRNLADGGNDADEIRALGLLGLAVRDKDGKSHLAIPLRHSGLAGLLKGSRYNKDGAWAGGLRDAPGAIWRHTVRISGEPIHCVLVPVNRSALQTDDKDTTPTRPTSFATAKTLN